MSFFAADELDAMQEIVNVSIGSTSAALSDVLDTYVVMTPPRVAEVGAARIAEVLTAAANGNPVHAVCQAFYAGLEGEVIVVFSDDHAKSLGAARPSEGSRAAQQETLLEAANIIAGGCLHGIGRQLDIEIRFSPPHVLGEGIPVDRILNGVRPSQGLSLLIETKLVLREYAVECHALILMPRDAAVRMNTEIARLMENVYA